MNNELVSFGAHRNGECVNKKIKKRASVHDNVLL